MRTVKLTIAYDGTDYVGWQQQPNGLSVQQCLERALEQMTGRACPVIGAGRTDAGVHAIGQVAHFKTDVTIPCHGFVGGLNSLLPQSIVITSAVDVEDGFHARRDAKGKIYRYVIVCSPHRMPFLVNRCWHIKEHLDVHAMRNASRHLTGENDYKSFRAAGCQSRHAIREIKRIEMSEIVIASLAPCGAERGDLKGHPERERGISEVRGLLRFARNDNDNKILSIDFEGDGFVRHMIRNIVGTLVDIGKGKMSADEIKAILNARQREEAGRCAPASGLYLIRVFY